MKYLINNSTDPYFNMAFDEYCLQYLECGENLFYLWRNRPSVIIGLNQNAYSEVDLEFLRSRGISLARRVTGGGAVYHDLQNMNYSFVGKDLSPETFAQALRSLGIEAELTGRNDIFVDGRKVSGYARRVFHDRELVHGTLMYDVDIDTLTRALDVSGSKLEAKGIASVRSRVTNLKDRFAALGLGSLDEVQAALGQALAAGDGVLELTQKQLMEIREMAERKFATWDWIYGHSKQANWTRRKKFACGNVEVAVSLSGGVIEDIRFTGDFLGDRPAGELEVLLRGVRFERDEAARALEGFGIEEVFNGISREEFLELLFER